MNRFKRLIATTLVLMMTFMLLTTTAFASGNEGNGSTSFTDDDRAKAAQGLVVEGGVVKGTGSMSGAAQYFTTDSNLGEGQPIDVNGTQVYVKSGMSQVAHNTMANAANSNSQAGNLRGQMFETTADLGGANTMLRGAMPYINLLIGLIIVVVTAGMTFFSACDIAYIAFPVFRNKCEEAKMNGGMGTKKGANGDTVLKFVTQDAQYAVQEGNLENGKSPWGIYFGKRVLSYIMLAIVIFILMTNNISLITELALNLVSGVMDVIQGLANGG